MRQLIDQNFFLSTNCDVEKIKDFKTPSQIISSRKKECESGEKYHLGKIEGRSQGGIESKRERLLCLA